MLQKSYTWTYTFPSKNAIIFYLYLYIPFFISVFLEIIKRIFKNNKIVQKIIFILNIILIVVMVLYFYFVFILASAFEDMQGVRRVQKGTFAP